MSTRFAGLIAVVVLIVSATSFTAQEPPRAPTDVAPPLTVPQGPRDPMDAVMRLEFRPGKEKGDHRIVWKHDGVEIEATRVSIAGPVRAEITATDDGMAVQTGAFSTVCKSIDLRPGALGIDPQELPSAKRSGRLQVTHSQFGYAALTAGSFRFECTKLVLAGSRNRLDLTPGGQALNIRTKDADIRAVHVAVTYDVGFRLMLDATTSPEKANGRETIRLVQQP